MFRGKQLSVTLIILLFGLSFSQFLSAHCQVPCGIYDDQMRIKMMSEHIDTIEKAMNQVIALSREAKPNYNQLVRWVTNKEKHAEEMSGIITYYFMAQRIKVPGKKEDYPLYQKKLSLLHHLLVYTMKAKQSVDTSLVPKLRDYLKKFEELYFHKK